MLYLRSLIFLSLVLSNQESTGTDPSQIIITDTGKYIPYVPTDIDAGPSEGFILNAHYFPALKFYNAGRYKDAESQLTYVVVRPHYLEANPRRPEFMSTAHYLRGMIYVYHASGLGRYTLAKADFEAAVKWNPLNYVVYLELSRVYSRLGFPEEAASVLRHLLSLMPDMMTAEEAQKELSGIPEKAH